MKFDRIHVLNDQMGKIISYDQGTTGTTCLLIDDKSFKIIDKTNQEFPQIYPQPGWVEHNLNDIWSTIEQTSKIILNRNNISKEEITAIGITNQRETLCAFEKSGNPLVNALVWQDRRTAEFCNAYKYQEPFIREKTGLPLDPYFSGPKIKWLLEHNEKVKNSYLKNDLCFGTIDTFLLYRFTNGSSFFTDASNASRTLLMNLQTCSWDDELLNFFKIDKNNLPQIKNSFGELGRTKNLSFLPDGIPITGILGDQQAALFGQAGHLKGSLKCTYGTGAFLLLNTGEEIKRSQFGLLSTVAYMRDQRPIYALEGSCYIAGAAVQYLRDNLKLISHSSQIEELALQVKDFRELEYILFLPFFTGIGSPYWNSSAKAALIGLTRDTQACHIAHACLDGIALSVNDVISSMRQDTLLDINQLKVDGGAASNNLLLKIQATISNLNIIRPQILETTGYGAALAAAVGADLLKLETLDTLWKKESEFWPMEHLKPYYEGKRTQWTKLIQTLFANFSFP